MREILFRGKRFDNGEWIEGYLIHDECCNTHIPYIGYLFGHDIDVAEIILGTVGQFAGLTDKNGKKVFEGDILKFTDTNADYEWIGRVEFGNPNAEYNWGYQLVYIEGVKPNTDILCWFDMEETGAFAEIIGNIHDNPELVRRDGNA